MSPSTFEPHVGSEFVIDTGDGRTVSTVLDDVERYPPRTHGERTEPFALTFLGPPGQPLPQKTYALTNAALGTLDVFIVPIGPDPSGRQRYEAVFN